VRGSVLIEFFTSSSSSSDNDELILIKHKKSRVKIKNYIEEVVRKMSDETVSFAG